MTDPYVITASCFDFELRGSSKNIDSAKALYKKLCEVFPLCNISLKQIETKKTHIDCWFAGDGEYHP